MNGRVDAHDQPSGFLQVAVTGLDFLPVSLWRCVFVGLSVCLWCVSVCDFVDVSTE